MLRYAVLGAALFTAPAFAQSDGPGDAPGDFPSEARLQADVERLVAFGTRHTASSATDPQRGIGAARDWAAAEFARIAQGCGGCLTVERQARQFEGPRAPDGVVVENVVAIQPGRRGFTHVIVVAGHIDSRVTDVMDATSDAPGANDNGSGSALVLEAARQLAGRQFDATIVYALLSGEEQGLWGGTLLAETARARGWNVSAFLNNDIVGNSVGTDGRVVANRVRLFSEGIGAALDDAGLRSVRGSGGEDDGPSRAVARAVDRIAEARPRIGLDVFVVRRPDRFGRGGDHLPALELGFPAVRFSVGVENYDAQHQDLRQEKGRKFGDTVDRMDFAYLAKVTALNVATIEELALAPPAPRDAVLAGAVSSDTKVSWKPVAGAARYRVHWRRSDARDWQDSRIVDGTETILNGVIVDDHFVGVSALSADGRESIVTFAGLPPRG